MSIIICTLAVALGPFFWALREYRSAVREAARQSRESEVKQRKLEQEIVVLGIEIRRLREGVKPAQPEPDEPMSPAEVEAAQGPAVEDEVRKINAGLIRGKRVFAVSEGIADAVADTMRAAGWSVVAHCRCPALLSLSVEKDVS